MGRNVVISSNVGNVRFVRRYQAQVKSEAKEPLSATPLSSKNPPSLDLLGRGEIAVYRPTLQSGAQDSANWDGIGEEEGNPIRPVAVM